MGKHIALLMAAATLGLTSCGGGGDDAAPRETPAISKARLIERADPVCREDQARLVDRLNSVPQPTRESAATTTLARVLEINADTILTGARKIEALGTPRTDAELLESYLDERTTAGNALRSAAKAARVGDLEGLQGALEAYGRSEAQAQAIEFGFKVCGLGATKATLEPPE